MWEPVRKPLRYGQLPVAVRRVHFLRNVLAVVPKGSSEMVAAAGRTVFAQPDAARVPEQFDTIAVMLGRQLPKVQTGIERRQGGPAGVLRVPPGALAIPASLY